MGYLSQITAERMVELATDPPTEEELLVATFKRYYEGDQDVELSRRQKEYILEQLGLPNSLGNVCKLVVSVISDRLRIEARGEGVRAFDADSTVFAEKASKWWTLAGLDATQSDVHRNTVRDRLAAVFVEWDVEENRPIITPAELWSGTSFDSSVRFFTDGNDNVIFAAKEWEYVDFSEDDTLDWVRLNIYQPGGAYQDDETGEIIEFTANVTRYIYRKGTGDAGAILLTEEQVSFETRGRVTTNPQELPTGTIPIFRFENFPDHSDIEEVIRQQDIINHYLSTIDISVDYHGWPMLTAEEFTNDDDHPVGPGEMLVGKNIKRVDPPDLEKLWKGTVIEQLRLLAILKRWPIWVLLTDSSGNAPSGEALRRQERPLVSQIEEKQNYFSIYWQNVFEHCRQLHNYYNDSDQIEGTLLFDWVDPSTTNQPETQRTKAETAAMVGMSMYTQLERIFGFTDKQIIEEFARIKREQEMGLLDFNFENSPDAEGIQSETATPEPATTTASTNGARGDTS